MIEIVYEKEKQKPEGNEGFFRIPNNIRQIGEIGGTQKIYIEDYAYTYLCRLSSENSQKGIAAILLGQANWRDGISYLFVKSAVALSDMEVSQEHLSFTQEAWNHVYEKNKEYFPDQEIIGWFLSIPGCSMELHQVICQTHLDHFGGNDKILFVIEPTEKEEAFYRYEEGSMVRQQGFYVYYEKNEPMHNFLIAQNERMEKKTEEVDDSAVHTFRKKVEKKAEGEKKENGMPVFKTAGVCALVAALAVGVLYLNDYKKLKSTQEVLATIDKNQTVETEKLPVNGNITENSAEGKTKTVNKGLQDEGNTGAAEAAEKLEEETEIQSETTETGNLLEDEQQDAEEANETETAGSPTYETYTIQQGDTITKISLRNYGTAQKVKAICQLNEMSENDFIYPGQKILLP